ncbi:FAD binding domain-containing protein [Alkalihalobacterium alkalinitrilicum]|uniref:FAD binding domain-containing protein n=1 Tax=Alkalihalobacterium alkalinitrilicum TaxID=427920 RepID=UPI0009951F15|nr:FAD binding domain-containing protein [Alkalihalobacterium alkalinitrilicum]
MISFDFEYYKPTSVTEATNLFQSLTKQGKDPIYFSGGTEVITLGRMNQIQTDAVIDIKGIPECLVLKKAEHKVTFGSAQSLTKIHEMQIFPFLNKAIVEIADHTARNKITLGGNLCANIIYRETVLPLLLTNSEVVIAGTGGLKQVPLQDVFDQKLNLEKGEFLVQVITEQSEIDCPFLCVKKRRQWDVGYPLITTAALKKDGYIKVAFSGLGTFPFRDKNIEESLNIKQLAIEERVDQALQQISVSILDDVNGSADYRLFVLKNTLLDVLDALEGGENV